MPTCCPHTQCSQSCHSQRHAGNPCHAWQLHGGKGIRGASCELSGGQANILCGTPECVICLMSQVIANVVGQSSLTLGMMAISRPRVLEKLLGLLGAVVGSGGCHTMHWRHGCLGHHICTMGHLVNLFRDPLQCSIPTSFATPSTHSRTPTLPTWPPPLPPPNVPWPWNIPTSHIVAGYPICPTSVYISLALALPTMPTVFHFLHLAMHTPFTEHADNWLQAHTQCCQNCKPNWPSAHHNAHQSMHGRWSHTSLTHSCCLHHMLCRMNMLNVQLVYELFQHRVTYRLHCPGLQHVWVTEDWYEAWV